MPRLTGIEATEYIRRGQCEGLVHSDTIPWIIAVTAINDRDACLASGMNDFMSKPLDPKTMKNALRTFAENRLARHGHTNTTGAHATANTNANPTVSAAVASAQLLSSTAPASISIGSTPRGTSSNTFSFTAPVAHNHNGPPLTPLTSSHASQSLSQSNHALRRATAAQNLSISPSLPLAINANNITTPTINNSSQGSHGNNSMMRSTTFDGSNSHSNGNSNNDVSTPLSITGPSVLSRGRSLPHINPLPVPPLTATATAATVGVNGATVNTK